MKIEYNLDDDLRMYWPYHLERQLHLKLSSMAMHVRTLRVRLTRAESSDQAAGYLCEIEAHLIQASRQSPKNLQFATARSPVPSICVADAASRLARGIKRELQTRLAS